MSRLTALTVLTLLAASPAYAYLDPGTGSILVQALLAGLAVASAAIAAFWSRIRQFLVRRPRPDKSEPGGDGNDTTTRP